MPSFRFAVSVMPKQGILDPQGRAVELSLPHLRIGGVYDVRVGRRVELTVDAVDEAAARVVVEHLASELFANPLIESWRVEPAAGASSIVSEDRAAPRSPDPNAPARDAPPARDAAAAPRGPRP